MEVQNPPGAILSTTVTLTGAELIALGTNAQELVPAPGGNNLIVPIGIVAIYEKGTVDFTAVSDSLVFGYDNTNGTVLPVSIDSLLTNAASGSHYVPGTIDGTGNLATNLGKNFAVAPQTAYAAGNGTLTITTFYQVISP